MTDVLKAHVIPDDRIPAEALIVCCREGTPTPYTDNVGATCAHCAHPIIHRPYIPAANTKICLECAMIMSEATTQ